MSTFLRNLYMLPVLIGGLGLIPAGAASFSFTGSMTTNRENHTATLLPNGTVLVVGGSPDDGNAYLSSAELYNPGSGTWTATTGAMANACDYHTATLLPNGKVLVAGGWNATASLSSVELYDPGTGKWTLTNAMHTARGAHTATLLPNGKVLVAGGGTVDGTGNLSSAELYDPTTGAWTMTGSMTTNRAYQTATLLPNGKVLVVGGGSGYHFANSIPGAELYDPATGKWTLTGAPNTPRTGHTATFLSNGKVLAVAGGSAGSSTDSAELYNPTTETWTNTGSLTTAPRHGHTATLLPNGQVLIAGGDNSTDYRLASAELYDAATGQWTATGYLNMARQWHTATLLPDGEVLIAGGKGGSSIVTASAELYSATIGAGWQGADDFSSAIYSSTNWTFFKVLGQMTIQVVNGHASCLDPTSTTDHQRAEMVWNGSPTVAEGWMVDILGHNTVPHGNGGSTLYLVTLDKEAWGSGQLYGFDVAMGQHSGGSSFGTSWQSPTGETVRVSFPCTNNTLFGLRLLYKPASQTIEAYYDPTGSGLGWTELDSITVSEMSPGMKATNTFLFAIVSDTFYGPITEGQLWADNFRLTNSAIGSALTVATTSLPNGTNGVAYSQTLAATGGQKPYSWTNSSGALPPGLKLATNGLISGTPTNSGTNTFTVKVTDTSNNTTSRALSLTVFGPPMVAIQPVNSFLTVPVGSNVTLTVLVTGTGPFTYQWKLNGTNIPNGNIITVAGNGSENYAGDGGEAINAELDNPYGVAFDSCGNLFIADMWNNAIRKVGTNGIITTVAGNGTNDYLGDGGAATNAELNYPQGVAVDSTGSLFIADTGNQCVRKLGTDGIINTMAGNGAYGYSGDGVAATNASLWAPVGVAMDSAGNLFIADEIDQRIRIVDTNGVIYTVAGNGTNDYIGDGGAATNAELYYPYGVAVGADGNLFIADTGNQRIREVGTNGIITTVAGNGGDDYPGDGGAATNAGLFDPQGLAVDNKGNLLIADSSANVIRKVDINGMISTVAGNGYGAGLGYGGYSGDGGAATNAKMNNPTGVAMDSTGNLFIADQRNNRIREVVFVQGPRFVLNDVGLGNAGMYDVVVSSPYGSVTSSVVNVNIPPFLSAPQIVGKTNFTFQLSGPAGSNYVVQVSTNLLNWTPDSTSTIPVSGTVNLTNAITNYNRRFYRVHLQ